MKNLLRILLVSGILLSGTTSLNAKEIYFYHIKLLKTIEF